MDKKKRSPLHSDHSVPDSQQAQPTGASNHPSPNSGQSAGLRNEMPSNEKDSFDDKNLSFRQSSDNTAEKISPDVTCEYPDGLRVRSRPAFRTLSRSVSPLESLSKNPENKISERPDNKITDKNPLPTVPTDTESLHPTETANATDQNNLTDPNSPAEESIDEWFDDIVQPEEHQETGKSRVHFVPPTTEEEYQRIAFNYRHAAGKAHDFPHRPGVYLMKDAADRVIYIGKAKNLHHRAGSYFQRTAMDDPRTAPLVQEIRDIDYIEAESEVDAVLMEARLIKDIQPKYNRDLKDNKSFPYLQITIYDEYPRVEITRTPRNQGVTLFGPFPSAGQLRGALIVLQKIFKFRTCTMPIRNGDDRLRHFRPCLLASIGQCSAPCNFRVSKEVYRKNIHRLMEFLNGNRKKLFRNLNSDMQEAAENRQYERAAELRDQIAALYSLSERGNVEEHAQPEVFNIDPRRGVVGLQKVFQLAKPPRIIEGIDIAHISGQDTVASLVQFLDGLPFKSGYRRYKIRSVDGIDDFASIAEVVSRRFSSAEYYNGPPDILLIDGGKGQLHAACNALRYTPLQPGMILSLAKKEEEIFVPDRDEPIKLSRHSFALRLLQYVRDESHRFAQHYHHILRKKTTFGE